ncbi:hypothetical protein I549_2272 [Mycobacterium avium subsp. avium 2285 (R)]|nr:hypothetical protein L837_1222 [Mycobacterium avium MAV_061107_1842]ETZ56620.1 hypothetical protein L840_3799 [Mycobacterium sp. MAC_011194_8550]ETZ67580.1 hypothetical protein L841_2581 [Mycobacterium sp. MAC_080597_8934]EUA38419.1 hypothetical protein I549_2272 [Mycobacterium avium subsp. avium 2285 (R)]
MPPRSSFQAGRQQPRRHQRHRRQGEQRAQQPCRWIFRGRNQRAEQRRTGGRHHPLGGVLDAQGASTPIRPGEFGDRGGLQPVVEHRDHRDGHHQAGLPPRIEVVGPGQQQQNQHRRGRDVADGPHPRAEPVRPATHRDPAERTEQLGERHQCAGGRDGPVQVPDQPHQHERHRHRLRHHHQARHRVNSPQRQRPSIRAGEFLIAGAGAGLARRVDDTDHAGDRAEHACQRGEAQSRLRTVFGQLGNDHGAQRDSQRLRGLADAHRQPALVRGEPGRHQSAAGRVAAGRRHAAEKQVHRDQYHGVCRRRGVGGQCGQRRAGGHHHPLADPVQHVAPRHERDHHSPAGHRGQQTGFVEPNPARALQRRDQECDAVDEQKGTRRRQQRNDHDRPAGAGADVGRGDGVGLHSPCLHTAGIFRGRTCAVAGHRCLGSTARHARLRRARGRHGARW